MQGLVTLDFGNTRATAGIFSLEKTPKLLKKLPLSALKENLSQMGFSAHNAQIALSDVRPREEELRSFVEEGYFITRVKDYWKGKRFHGMAVNYTETLGEDRLISAFYVFKKLKTNALIIDAGTFVTIDVITQEGFQGGFIAPGTEAYFSSFQRGENLKSVSLTPSTMKGIPHDTMEAMARSYSAFAALVREITREHQIQKVLITGGGASFWQELLSDLDVEMHPDLIHFALHYWMTTQIEPL